MNICRRLLLFPGFLLLTSTIFGQHHQVSGMVNDQEGTSVPFANVVMLQVKDSSVVKGVSTDDKGQFHFQKVPAEDYIVKVSFLGYKDFFKKVKIDQDLVLPAFILEESAEQLGEVEIKFIKPSLKKLADRLVFTVEKSPLVEGNMFDVVRNTPGVLVLDQTITVKNEVPAVYINDRKVNLTGEELVQLLEGTSATAIKAIEVITNPSAKYEASSGAVINIVMSKNLITGYRGNVSGQFIQGVFPRYETGMAHFFKNERWDVFANYTFSKSKINRNQESTINYLDDQNEVEQIYGSKINRNTWSNTHNLSFNIDYKIDEQNALALSSNLLFLPYFDYKIDNFTQVFDHHKQLMYYFDAKNRSADEKHNLGFDFDYTHKFDQKGQQLLANAHFTSYDYDRAQRVSSKYYNASDAFINASDYRTANNQKTKIYNFKMDYENPLSESSKLELGTKWSVVDNGSGIIQYNQTSDGEVIDPNNTNDFQFKENIWAGYANFSHEWSRWSLVTGLRTEYTLSKGKDILTTTTNKQDYLELFPNASLTFNFTDAANIYGSYKRHITRPNYEDLNPFQFYLNDFTIVTGNPQLKPVITQRSVLGTSLAGGKFNFELFYQTEKNNIVELTLQDNLNNQVIYQPLNLGETVEYGLDFVTYFNVMDWWSTYFITSIYNLEEKGKLEGMPVKRSQWTNQTSLSNDFRFLKDRSLTANLSITYLSNTVHAFTEMKSVLFSNLSISKSVLKNKGTISLMASDLFNRQDFTLIARYLNQNNTNYFDQDTRTLKIGFRYNFGNTKLETNQRTTILEERDRLIKD